MKSTITVPRVVFYPCIIIFALICWYIGFNEGQHTVPLGFEVLELPACTPDPAV